MLPRTETRLIDSGEELQAFAAEWRSLWLEDERATPFQHPAWLLPWWREFRQPQLRAVTAIRSGRAVALLPFYIYNRTLLLLGAGTSDYLDGVFARDCRADEVGAALELAMGGGDWDMLCASQLRSGSPLLQALERFGERQNAQSCSRLAAAASAPCNRKPSPTLPLGEVIAVLYALADPRARERRTLYIYLGSGGNRAGNRACWRAPESSPGIARRCRNSRAKDCCVWKLCG